MDKVWRGGQMVEEYDARVKVLTEDEWENERAMAAVSRGAQNQASIYNVLDAAMAGTARSTEEVVASQQNLAASTDALNAALGGAAANEIKNYNSQQDELKSKAAEVMAELDKLIAVNGTYVTVQKNTKATTADLNLWTLQLADTQAKLAEATDPLKQAQLAEKAETLQGKINDATGAVVYRL